MPSEEVNLKLGEGDMLLAPEGVPPETKIPPSVGIGAIALNMALKYCDINTVQDGTLYQQYKLEGRNMHNLHLAEVFDVAIQIERHLVRTEERILQITLDIIDGIAEEVSAEKDDSPETPSDD
jgi:hypothetical protein